MYDDAGTGLGYGGSGTQAAIYDCNGEPNQHWTVPYPSA